MVLIDKEFAIRQVETIPIICDHCSHQSLLGQPTEEVCDALITASYVHQFQQELVLLQRTQTLFERFPKSRHEYKLTKEYLSSRRPKSQPDPQLRQRLTKIQS